MPRSFGINVQQKIKEKWVERSASASQGFYLTEGQSAEDKDNIILSQTFPFLEQQLPTLGKITNFDERLASQSFLKIWG